MHRAAPLDYTIELLGIGNNKGTLQPGRGNGNTYANIIQKGEYSTGQGRQVKKEKVRKGRWNKHFLAKIPYHLHLRLYVFFNP